MLKRVLVFTILSTLLSSCATGPEGYFKRSANNKIIDSKGFKGGKRTPLYNKKYISQAKKNILSSNYDEFDEDYDEEEENISRENIEMYKAMIEEDLERANKYKSKGNKRKTPKMAYPSIVEEDKKINSASNPSNLELREEMEQIKSMLAEAKKDLSSYKCPTAKSIEQQEEQKKTVKAKEAEKSPKKENIEVPTKTKDTTPEPTTSDSVIIEPKVKSL
ncbi:MAG: hypothetical protein P8P83_04125 [Rickettsiaceae bacterium]|nr:hypothetical protein [Rickettsiaceae bacterium]